MIENGLLLGFTRSVRIIGGYLGVIGSDVQRLRHESLSSAITFLNYALNCHDEEKFLYYTKEALSNFVKAESLEDDEEKVESILGIYTCQRLLGDTMNANDTLKRIANVSLSSRETAIACGAGVVYGLFGGIIDNNAHSFNEKLKERKCGLEIVKEKAIAFAKSI